MSQRIKREVFDDENLPKGDLFKNLPSRGNRGGRSYNPHPWDSAAELDFLRDACRRDFWMFFLYAFGARTNPKGTRWIEPKVHKPLARWFQHHVMDWHNARLRGEGMRKRLAVIVHRGVGKTTLISAAGQAWLHLLDPEISTFTGSEKHDLSMQTLDVIRAVLDGSDPYAMWSILYGDWKTSARQWSGKQVTHAARKNTARRDPSFGTFAVETSIVGAHPDALFYDDPTSYERLISDVNWLQTVNSQITSLYPVMQKDALIVMPATRYDDDDHFGTMLRSAEMGGEGVRSISGMETDQFKIEEDGAWDLYFMAGRDAEGKPTTVKAWPEHELVRYQRRDPLRYAAQIMNDPAISEFNPITREQIQQCGVPAKEVPFSSLRIYLCCDTAFWDGKSRAKKDWTVVVVQGPTRNGSGDVYILEAHGSPTWRSEDFKKRLVVLTQRYRQRGFRIAGIVDEDPHGGKRGTWQAELRNAFNDVNEPMPPFIEVKRGGGQARTVATTSPLKIRRMVAAANFWVDGHVRYIEGAPGIEQLKEQMAKIGQYMVNPNLQNDWADAHAMIFEYPMYQPMRMTGKPSAYMEDAQPIRGVDGMEFIRFDRDDEPKARPPIR